MDVAAYILQNAAKYGIDPLAAIAVAQVESQLNPRAVGDNGTSFGPFQLHQGGALPAGRGLDWAASPEGISYALQRMAEAGARGLTGQAAINDIFRNFERPADPTAEIKAAVSNYGPRTEQTLGVANQALPFDPLAGFKYSLLGKPGQGTHTVGNWQSDNAWDYGAPAGTPVYAVAPGTIDPNHYGPLAKSGRFGGNRVTLIGPGNEFFYQHLADNLAVKPGQHVNAGDLLGYIGNVPGLGNHLHFGVQNLNAPVPTMPLPASGTAPAASPASPGAAPLPPAPVSYQTFSPQPLSVPKLPTFAAPAAPPGFLDHLSSGGASEFNRIIASLTD